MEARDEAPEMLIDADDLHRVRPNGIVDEYPLPSAETAAFAVLRRELRGPTRTTRPNETAYVRRAKVRIYCSRPLPPY